MPGLFGWVASGNGAAPSLEAGRALLAEMAARLSHNGNESVDEWRDVDRGFAIGRVAVSLEGQPPWPASGARSATFVEGHLHGSPEEVGERLRDLGRRGASALSNLRGSFTVARWDDTGRRLLLAVDRRASRPLVHARVGGTLYFAPEVKALLAVPGLPKALDEAAAGIFLGSGYLLAEQTLLRSVRRLAGGHHLVAGPSGVTQGAYWRYRLDAAGDGSDEETLAHELSGLVARAVGHDASDPQRTIVFLSGGVDSRAIAEHAQIAAKRRGASIQTVTWSSTGAPPGSDLAVAQRVASALGARHRTIERSIADYGRRFVEVTYLLDGLSDVGAFHPSEHAVMRSLAATGTRTVLRGDECFGWLGPVGSASEALLSLNLRPLSPLRFLGSVLRPGPFARMGLASSEALEEAAAPFERQHPDDVRDQLYFAHRLQGYLGSAAYLKLVLLDHRAPLLDEAILEFNARVPARLRHEKRLFEKAARLHGGEVWSIPLASRDNLEDWGALLAGPSPVRSHVTAELADRQNPFWELCDPEALRGLLPPVGRPPGSSRAALVTQRARSLARGVLSIVAPPVERRAVAEARRHGLRLEQACLRLLVLKTFHDLFLAGDGSRRALSTRLEEIAA